MRSSVTVCCPFCHRAIGLVLGPVIDSIKPEEEPPTISQEVLNMPVDSLSWGEQQTRIMTIFKAEGISKISQLLCKTERELMRTPNFGRKSLGCIETTLRGMGLHVGMLGGAR